MKCERFVLNLHCASTFRFLRSFIRHRVARVPAEGIDARVISMHTIKPLDVEETLRAARETRAIVTVEEHSITGGLGSAVAEVLAESGLTSPFRRFGVPDRISHAVGDQHFLRQQTGDLHRVVHDLIGGVKQR